MNGVYEHIFEWYFVRCDRAKHVLEATLLAPNRSNTDTSHRMEAIDN